MCAMAAALFGASTASADILYVTFTGTVAEGSDATGVFGAPGASLDGDAFVATLLFNDDLGVRDTFSPYFDYTDGGPFFGTSDPSLGAKLTINGVTVAFTGNSYGSVANFAFEGETTVDVSDASSVSFDASFLELDLYASGVPGSLDTPYSATGSPGLSNLFQFATGPGSLYTSYAGGTLAPTSVRVSVGPAPVPEAASWTLMLAGCSLMGAALRLGRRGRSGALGPAFAG